MPSANQINAMTRKIRARQTANTNGVSDKVDIGAAGIRRIGSVTLLKKNTTDPASNSAAPGYLPTPAVQRFSAMSSQSALPQTRQFNIAPDLGRALAALGTRSPDGKSLRVNVNALSPELKQRLAAANGGRIPRAAYVACQYLGSGNSELWCHD